MNRRVESLSGINFLFIFLTLTPFRVFPDIFRLSCFITINGKFPNQASFFINSDALTPLIPRSGSKTAFIDDFFVNASAFSATLTPFAEQSSR